MSTVRTFDVPHIVRYGRQDDRKGETWVQFWRCGTSFTVDIKRDDIAGTPFEPRWSELAKEPKSSDIIHWADRWDMFCDLVIEHILPTLQKLAPADKSSWVTLEDYLSTPLYKLRLFKDDTSGDAVPKISEGPTTMPAFEMQTYLPSELSFTLPTETDFQRLPASHLVVLDHDKDLRARPHKVQVVGTDQVYDLIPCQRSSQNGVTKEITNDSLDNIRSLLILRSLSPSQLGLLNMAQPTALVTTTSTKMVSPSRHAGSSTAPGFIDPDTTEESPLRIAGLLVQHIPNPTALSDKVNIASPNSEHARWHSQLSSTLTILHSHGIVHGNVNPHTVRISRVVEGAADGDTATEPSRAYLSTPNNKCAHPAFIKEELQGTEEGDWMALRGTFGGWMEAEKKKLAGELDKKYRWTWQEDEKDRDGEKEAQSGVPA